MKVKKHRDGTYSIVELRQEDLKDIQASLESRGLDFAKGADVQVVPYGYDGWTLETYREISENIRDRHYKMAEYLKPYAYPA